MITGHVGIAAAVRSGWRDTSFVWLLAATVAPDVLDAAMAIAGICNPYGLYSHTVPAAALIAAVLGGAALLVSGSRQTAFAVALIVMLHLPADMITGHKIFWPGGPMIGLDLYARSLLDFLIEAPILLLGWWMLRRFGRAPRWATSVVSVVAFLVLQGAFDLVQGDGVKPTACRTAPRHTP